MHLVGLARPVHHLSVLHRDLDVELFLHLAETKRSWFPSCSSPKNGGGLDGWMACHRGRDWMFPLSSMAVTVRSSSLVGLDGIWISYFQSCSSAPDVKG